MGDATNSQTASATVVVAAIVRSRELPDRLVSVTHALPAGGRELLELPAVLVEDGECSVEAALRGLKALTGLTGTPAAVSASLKLVCAKGGVALQAINVDADILENRRARPRTGNVVELLPLSGLCDSIHFRAVDKGNQGVVVDTTLLALAVGLECGLVRESEIETEMCRLRDANAEMENELKNMKQHRRSSRGSRERPRTSPGKLVTDRRGAKLGTNLLRLSMHSLDRLGLRVANNSAEIMPESTPLTTSSSVRSIQRTPMLKLDTASPPLMIQTDDEGAPPSEAETAWPPLPEPNSAGIERTRRVSASWLDKTLGESEEVGLVIICDPGSDVQTEMAIVRPPTSGFQLSIKD